MFKKPYKTKTSTAIKSSERKRLRTVLESSFPSLTPEDINSLIPSKGDLNQVKAMTHSHVTATIYCIGSNPVFFQIEDKCYPTVYTLWKYPKILPVVTTVPPVLEKISNGADLMAPGVVVDETTLPELEGFKKGGLCAVRILGNQTPFAVGMSLLSKNELCADGVKGKAVAVVHSYNDTLWASGDQQNLPVVPDNEVAELSDDVKNLNVCDGAAPENETGSIDTQCGSEEIMEEPKIEEPEPSYTMDEILHNAFLTALKVHGKKLSLPILTITFYRNHVRNSCPPSLNVDVRKTKYKKLSVFLKEMQKQGAVQVKELTKGVDSIVAINLESGIVASYTIDPLFKQHIVSEKEKCVVEEPSSNIQENYKFPNVTELHVISAQVKGLFDKYKIRKGETLTSAAVKEVIKCYVKENSLQNETNPREVTLDPILSDCVSSKGGYKSVMTWEELQEAIVSKMPPAYQIEYEDKAPIVKKGKLEPIQITIDTRSGNKKVTLVGNLETYGLNIEKLAQHIQVAVAASTSIVTAPCGKGTLLLIQGNQVLYLQKLFLEIFKVPRKYLQGLENAPKKKK